MSDSMYCMPCAHLPSDWFWDVEGDEVADFVVSSMCIAPAVVGGRASCCEAYLASARKGQDIGFAHVIYPVTMGEIITSDIGEKRRPLMLAVAMASCGKRGKWQGRFVGQDGGLVGFQVKGVGGSIVGWARIQIDECDGQISILDSHYAPEGQAVTVGEKE